MSGSHVFVLLIIIIVFSFGLIKAWMANRNESRVDSEEADEMLAKIDSLEERIRVLERIITESKIDLKQEIDNL